MFWLEATTGQWSWGMCAEDEDDPFTFTNWQQGQPDDYGKLNLNVIVTLHACNDSNSYQQSIRPPFLVTEQSEDCMHLREEFDFQWNDISCYKTMAYVACQVCVFAVITDRDLCMYKVAK